MDKDNKRLKASSNFILRNVDGEAVLIPMGNTGVFENNLILMNETCCFLWQLFQKPRTIEEVLIEARKEYSDFNDQVEQDIRKFIDEFSEYDLLKEV